MWLLSLYRRCKKRSTAWLTGVCRSQYISHWSLLIWMLCDKTLAESVSNTRFLISALFARSFYPAPVKLPNYQGNSTLHCESERSSSRWAASPHFRALIPNFTSSFVGFKWHLPRIRNRRKCISARPTELFFEVSGLTIESPLFAMNRFFICSACRFLNRVSPSTQFAY